MLNGFRNVWSRQTDVRLCFCSSVNTRYSKNSLLRRGAQAPAWSREAPRAKNRILGMGAASAAHTGGQEAGRVRWSFRG
jgi:hypothetical protein